ncbi:uncharacterized protein K452DRAFT_114681 [Aplosporella prunicola CBS 121167]|uniref:Uncharacterized protein n=1 Tax=Aplosporella prunicola CBS 121167 TaxID=1176127 RepID=A0A6A6AYI5_9PEZI|nr:uncharacterized protein K452DRAFT_114681 [Aplosporella prunicola CBS 121167]KAF2136992.1 hypothetical protein K452DRAFT_114681 [Aplosporella prunicola CBS 121167]
MRPSTSAAVSSAGKDETLPPELLLKPVAAGRRLLPRWFLLLIADCGRLASRPATNCMSVCMHAMHASRVKSYVGVHLRRHSGQLRHVIWQSSSGRGAEDPVCLSATCTSTDRSPPAGPLKEEKKKKKKNSLLRSLALAHASPRRDAPRHANRSP